jgi:hypothetical protein
MSTASLVLVACVNLSRAYVRGVLAFRCGRAFSLLYDGRMRIDFYWGLLNRNYEEIGVRLRRTWQRIDGFRVFRLASSHATALPIG